MENIGIWELLLIMVVVLLLFGAKRLPEMGAGLGKGIREFKRSLAETSDAIGGAAPRHDGDAAGRSGQAAVPGHRDSPRRLSE